MSVRGVRIAAALYFVGYAVAVTWPGALPLNRVQPLVFGLPLNMVWMALLVIGGGLVLWWLDRSEARHRAKPSAADRGPLPPRGAGGAGRDRPGPHGSEG